MNISQLSTTFLNTTNKKIYKWAMWLILLIGSLFKLGLVSGQHLQYNSSAMEDDRLFINLANNILHGQWLGSYNSLTLIKGPFYPIYLALIHLIHTPLLLSEQILYIIACLVFLVSIYPFICLYPIVKKSNKLKYIIATLLGLALIFNPISSDTMPAARVIRNGIYPALTLLTVSLFIALVAYRKSKLWKYIFISIAAGLVLSSFWLTREDGIWIIPFCVSLIMYLFGLTIWQRAKTPYWKWRLAILLLPFIILWLSVFTISSINYHYYRVNNVVEVQSPQFLDAYSSLTRVETGNWVPVIPVSKSSREAIYKISPAFSQLKPYLEGNIGEAWTNISASVYPQYPGEIAGGWFLWAFRYSVEAAGYYKNGHTAMNYYQQLANQVNGACNQGKLTCTKSTDNMYPPLNSRYIHPFISTMGHAFNFISGFQQYNPSPPNIIGDPSSFKLFSIITNEPISNYNNQRKIDYLVGIGKIYQLTFPVLTYLSILIYLILLFVKKVYANSLFIILGLVVMVIVVRMILLSLVTATSFPGINTLYFACIYPLLIIFDFMTLFTFLDLCINKISDKTKLV